MKRSISLLLAVMLLLSLAACSADEQNASSIPDTDRDQESTVTPTEESRLENVASSTGSNILIAYFSVSENVDTDGVDAVAGASVVVKDGEKLGNTEYVARLIQETVGGDLFRIETVEPYPLDHDPLVD